VMAVVLTAAAAGSSLVAQQRPKAPASPRLYIFEGGTIKGLDPALFTFKKEELAETDFVVMSYLVVHPKGTLMWDAAALPDAELTKEGTTTRYRIVLPNGNERFVTTTRKLASQLAQTGYSPADINYLALSHYHYDHTGNANLFANATWLVRKVERDIMFPDKPNDLTRPETYARLKSAKTTIVNTDDYDVFGDGTVVLKFTPGHTPGHQVLFLKLAKTGPVVISGDLYHYPEERTLHRVPTFDVDPKATAASREALDAFMQKAGAKLWIQHDLAANLKTNKAPAFYE